MGRTPQRCLWLGRGKTLSWANFPEPRGAPRRRRPRPRRDCSAGPHGGGSAAPECPQPVFPQHPRGLPQRILGRLPARRSGSGTHAHGPARPRQLRWLRQTRGPVGLPRAPRGRRRVSPARRPDPFLERAAAAGRCGAGGGFVCSRGALRARGEAPRAGTAEDALLRGQPRLCSRGQPAGGSRRPSAHDDPSSSPAVAPSPPAPLLTDGANATTRRRCRGC